MFPCSPRDILNDRLLNSLLFLPSCTQLMTKLFIHKYKMPRAECPFRVERLLKQRTIRLRRFSAENSDTGCIQNVDIKFWAF
jgi:hypothetical protein